jgi:ABC-type multidrug transport system fused ATPase/permease subunit
VRTDSAIVRKGLRILGMAIRTRPRPFAVSIVGACLYGGMTVAASVVIGRVTDRVIVPAFSTGAVGRGTLALAAAAILGVAVFKAVGIVLRRVGASIMQYQLHAEFRRRVTRRYLRLPLSWHSAHPTGELLSNANADVEAAFAPIAPLPMSAGVALMLLITGVLLVTTDPFLALIGFAVGPAIGLVNWRYNRRVQGPTTRAQQLRAEVSGIAHESFDGALVVKTLGRERQETDRFRASSEALRDQLVRLGRLRAVFDPLLEALPQLGVLAVLLVGTWRVAAGQLTQGSLVQFAYLFLQLAFPIRIIGYLLAELPRSVVGWERVERVLSATGEAAYPDAAPGEHAAATGPAHAALDDVTFRYTLDHGELHEVLRSVAFAASRDGSWRSSGRPARASRRSRRCSCGSRTPTRAPCGSTGVTSGPCRGARWRERRRSSSSTPSSSTTPCAPTSPWVRRSTRRTSGRRWTSRRPAGSSRRCRPASTPSSASAAPRCPGGSASGWRWRAPSSAARAC